MLRSCDQKSFDNTENLSETPPPPAEFRPPQHKILNPPPEKICILKTKRIHVSAFSPFDVHVKVYMYYSYTKEGNI